MILETRKIRLAKSNWSSNLIYNILNWTNSDDGFDYYKVNSKLLLVDDGEAINSLIANRLLTIWNRRLLL